MNTAEQILVIILSGSLAVFLLLGIMVLLLVIKILNHIKNITEKAEKIADQAEHVGDIFSKAAGPLAIGRLLANISQNVFHQRKSTRKGEEDE